MHSLEQEHSHKNKINSVLRRVGGKSLDFGASIESTSCVRSSHLQYKDKYMSEKDLRKNTKLRVIRECLIVVKTIAGRLAWFIRT